MVTNLRPIFDVVLGVFLRFRIGELGQNETSVATTIEL